MFIARRARWRIRVLSFLAGAALAGSAAAQSSDPPPSLDRAPPAIVDAVRDAWARNPAVQAADARVGAAQARSVAAGRPLYNPELELGAENADVDKRSVGISQAFDWSGKRKVRQTAATAEARVAEAERDGVRQRIALEWLRGYAALDVAAERVALGARRVESLQQFAELAERRLRAGDIPVLERDFALLALHEARAQHAELLADEAGARQIIANVGGRGVALPPLPRALPPPAEFPSQSSPILSLPALRQAQAETDAAYARIAVAERDKRADPTISLAGGSVGNGSVHDRLVGVVVRIPLFVRNSYDAELTAARLDADAFAATQHDRQRRAGAEAEQAAASYNALREAWRAWQQSPAPPSTDRAALLRKLWEAGEISAADYIVQVKQSIDTELTASALRARAWQAWADWLAASGGLGAWLGAGEDVAIASKELPR
jgi:outer membrane protein, heavy metal efflux system